MRHLLYIRGLYALSLILAFFMATPALATPLHLGPDIPYRVITDPQGDLSLQQAIGVLERHGKTEHTVLSRGYTSDAFWLEFKLPATLFDGQERWLKLGPNFIDDIRVFSRPTGSSQPWQVKRTGDLVQDQSDLDYHDPIFVLPAPSKHAGGYDVMMRVQSSSSTILHANLWQPKEFVIQAAKSSAFWGFYFGLAILSTLLALVLAIILKGPMLWSAVAFSSSFVLVASIQGYINWLLPDISFPLQNYLTSITTLTSYAAALWLCTETIDLRQNLPRVHKLLITLSVIILSLTLLVPTGHYAVAIRIQSVLYLLGSSVFIGSLFFLWWRSRFHPSTLLLGAVPLTCVAGSFIGMLLALGIVPFQVGFYVTWQYMLISLVLLVTAIAVYRIREQKLKEIEKNQLARELKTERDANFHQRQFMGMVSHEFRTPLAVISGTLENLWLLEDEKTSVRAGRYNKINRATERLTLLTDNCLADARLAADKLYLNPTLGNLIDLVHSATDLVELSSTHQLSVTCEDKPIDAATRKDWAVQVDTALIRIALSNVIDNAIKHSDGGCIRIKCANRHGLSAIHICDEGPGIHEENINWIFERYHRGPHARRGAGLGLFIAREICRTHKGDLKVVATGTRGTCFELTFNSKDGGLGQ